MLTTAYGKKIYQYLRPLDFLYQILSRSPGLEAMLLERHKRIDQVLINAIEKEGYEQIIEIASGLSARALRFTQKYPGIVYFETDLSKAIKLKQKLLGTLPLTNHKLLSVDLLTPSDWTHLLKQLDPGKKTLLISEGILGYLEHENVLFFWFKIFELLSKFPAGMYLADYRLDGDQKKSILQRLSKKVLGKFVKGKINFNFNEAPQLIDSLCQIGFRNIDMIESQKYPDIKNKVFKAVI